MIRFWMTSDYTRGDYYEADVPDGASLLDIARKYGRAESGEIITADSVPGKTAYWDSQYHKYRIKTV